VLCRWARKGSISHEPNHPVDPHARRTTPIRPDLEPADPNPAVQLFSVRQHSSFQTPSAGALLALSSAFWLAGGGWITYFISRQLGCRPINTAARSGSCCSHAIQVSTSRHVAAMRGLCTCRVNSSDWW